MHLTFQPPYSKPHLRKMAVLTLVTPFLACIYCINHAQRKAGKWGPNSKKE
jgi:hypothetical protein